MKYIFFSSVKNEIRFLLFLTGIKCNKAGVIPVLELIVPIWNSERKGGILWAEKTLLQKII